ncbi:MAG: T9SS type A sorting domain-containing protein, partial [Ignavibacteriaceae bacterium]
CHYDRAGHTGPDGQLPDRPAGDTIRTKTYGDLGTDRCFDMILIDEEFLLIAATNFNDVTDGDASLLLIYSGNEPTVIDNENETLPHGFVLYYAYPNPFNPVTTIKYSIPNVGTGLALSVYLAIFDILGNEITTLVNEEKSAGIHEVEFNASHLSSGTYFYRLNAVDNTTGKQFSETKKLMLIK